MFDYNFIYQFDQPFHNTYRWGFEGRVITNRARPATTYYPSLSALHTTQAMLCTKQLIMSDRIVCRYLLRMFSGGILYLRSQEEICNILK